MARGHTTALHDQAQEPAQRGRRLRAVLGTTAKITLAGIAGVVLGITLHRLLERQTTIVAVNAATPAIQGELGLVHSHRPGVRVLFIGNSFTAENAMIMMLAGLAGRGEKPATAIYPVEYAPGGSTLAMASRDPRVIALLRSARWNDVVLQEQSQIPELPHADGWETLPSARVLERLARRSGARTYLSETWGYQGGDTANWRNDTFGSMQRRLRAGYALLGRDLGVSACRSATPGSRPWPTSRCSASGRRTASTRPCWVPTS